MTGALPSGGHYADFQYEIYEAGLGGARPRWPVDEPSLRALARQVMSDQAYSYTTGDAGLGDAVRANREAFAARRLVPRVLAGAFPRDHAVVVLGTPMPAPVLLAPIGVLKLINAEGEVGAARAAADLGLTFVHSTASTTPMEEVAQAVGGPTGGAPRWYQMYVPRSPELAASFLHRAQASGYGAVVVTLDTTTRAWRPSDLNLGHLPFLHGHGIANYLADPVFRASLQRSPEEDLPAAVAAWRATAADPRIDWSRIVQLREQTPLPLVLKGVLHPEDARHAADLGVDGVVVSNHGGRQLDGAVAALDALPGVVDAVGARVEVLFDSGVRSGADVVKALALGARAVLLGRPWVWGFAVGGREGAVHALRSMLADYDVAMGLVGKRSPRELGRADLAHLMKGPTMQLSPLGTTGLSVTPLCLGTSPLGDTPAVFGYGVSEEQAVATIVRVLDGPITFIDTSNGYGDGESERRIGLALAQVGGLPDGFVLATKVDPAPGSDDFSGARVRASVHESLARLGLEQLQVVHLHDPERITFEQATGPGGPLEALVALQEEGLVGHLGVAGGPIDLELRYLALDVFDVVLSHNRYTLVDSSAEPLLADATARGVAFLNAAPYGGGMLVKGPDAVPTYCYRPAGPEVLARVRAMQAACAAREVPLAAAALQFSLREPRITSTVVGMSDPARIDATLALAEHPIDDELWSELTDLAAPGRAGVGL